MSGSVTDTSSVYSGVSVTSAYRHHHAGPFAAHRTASEPQPVLVKDAKHQPKTHGTLGILVVGLGGANGTTLLAGVLANRQNVHWHGARGEPMEPNYNGCISQLEPKGVYGGVGYKGRIKGLANVSMAAIGGWVRARDGLADRAGRLGERVRGSVYDFGTYHSFALDY